MTNGNKPKDTVVRIYMKASSNLARKNRIVVTLIFLLVLVSVSARSYIHLSVRGQIYNVSNVPKCRVAMVLGCKVFPNGRLSPMLADRCDKAIELYKLGKVDKLLMSGDNRFIRYNEPKHMCDYAISKGIPKDDVIADFAGRRTYDSAYRAKHIFGLSKIIVVTQPFHMDRSLYLCRAFGIDAYGVSAESEKNMKSILREFPACLAAVIDVNIRHPHTVIGAKEKI